MVSIYFDNAATTKPLDGVCDVVIDVMKEQYYNPSSPYGSAINIEKAIDASRTLILKSLNAKGKVVFTSGGSESNNLAIYGGLKKLRNAKIITSTTEHPSVYNTCVQAAKEFDCELVYLPVDSKGYIIKDALHQATKNTQSALISIMHVNNETGTIQDIEGLARIAKENLDSCVFHSDGVQGYMKANPLSNNSSIDMYTISAHKIHGPKGVGALYIKDKRLINPIVFGGGQENNIRSGTHNTPGICGLGKAVDIITATQSEYISTMHSIKRQIIASLDSSDVDYIVCGDSIESSAPHILNIAFKDIMGEVLLSALDNDGLIANTGSACSSKRTIVSPVLKAMNVDRKYIKGALRLSFGAYSTVDEAKLAAQIIINNIKRLRRYTRA